MASDDFQFDEVFEHNSQELEDPNLDTDQLEDDEDPYSENDEEEEEEDEGDVVDLIPENRRGLDDFVILKHIGAGAYGRVYQVKEMDTDKVFAMKLLKKSYLLKTNSVANTITERDVLRKVRHPFIVRLHYTFQTIDRVIFIMDFVQGGQLFFHLRKEAVFDEPTVRFYTAELILALEHLHEHHIIHRDLKPENILVGADGHIVLTDFGLAKEQVIDHESGAKTWCGTIQYMAPEMLQGRNYGKAADFWSVGILIFDMLFGRPPFRDANAKKLADAICSKKITMPQFWKAETHSIVKALTMKDPTLRLKVQGIKSHAFFKGLDWGKLLKKQVAPPYVPTVSNNLDLTNFDAEDLAHPTTFSPADPLPDEHADIFAGFSYTRPQTPLDLPSAASAAPVPASPQPPLRYDASVKLNQTSAPSPPKVEKGTAKSAPKSSPSLLAASDLKVGNSAMKASKYHDIN